MITTQATVDLTLTWSQSDTGDATSIKDSTTVTNKNTINSGTGIAQSNTVWLGSGTLTAAQQSVLDLYSLTRTFFGKTVNTSYSGGNIKSFVLQNISTGLTSSVILQNTGTNDLKSYSNNAAASLVVNKGSAIVFTNESGYTVNSSNRYLRLTDSGNGSSYKLAIIGSV